MQEVGAIDTGGVDTDPDLAPARFSSRNSLNLKDFWASRLPENHGSHLDHLSLLTPAHRNAERRPAAVNLWASDVYTVTPPPTAASTPPL